MLTQEQWESMPSAKTQLRKDLPRLALASIRRSSRSGSGKAGWKKAGRIVRKGEHGFLILVPSKQRESVPMGKDENEIDNYIADDEGIKPALTKERFYSATVFDISQTESINQQEIAA